MQCFIVRCRAVLAQEDSCGVRRQLRMLRGRCSWRSGTTRSWTATDLLQFLPHKFTASSLWTARSPFRPNTSRSRESCAPPSQFLMSCHPAWRVSASDSPRTLKSSGMNRASLTRTQTPTAVFASRRRSSNAPLQKMCFCSTPSQDHHSLRSL